MRERQSSRGAATSSIAIDAQRAFSETKYFSALVMFHFFFFPIRPLDVSIHAPAWGATPVSISFSILAMSFNPRAREGRDRVCRIMSAFEFCFNPRAREGRDLNQCFGLATIKWTP